jgi:hypothetical protein
MVKPLHAGLAARNGVLAALLAQAGLSASADAIAGSQGFLAAMCSERDSAGFDEDVADLGAPVGNRRYRHHGQAVPVVRGDASDARRPPRPAARAPVHWRGCRRHRCRRRSDHPHGSDSRPSDHRAPGQVQHAVLRRGRCRPRPCRHRHVRRPDAARPAIDAVRSA